MMMLMLDGNSGSSGLSDLLPLMMMGGMGGGADGGMGGMLPLLLLGDDEKTEAACKDKFKIDAAYETKTAAGKITKVTDQTAIFNLIKADSAKCKAGTGCPFGASTWSKDYASCVIDAKGVAGSSSSSSKLSDLLPLMMMGGMGGAGGAGGMDPMMMMLALK
jgi:hypothetical protein